MSATRPPSCAPHSPARSPAPHSTSTKATTRWAWVTSHSRHPERSSYCHPEERSSYCHPEERSDEGSAFATGAKSRSLASLGMTSALRATLCATALLPVSAWEHRLASRLQAEGSRP